MIEGWSVITLALGYVSGLFALTADAAAGPASFWCSQAKSAVRCAASVSSSNRLVPGNWRQRRPELRINQLHRMANTMLPQ